MNALQSSVPKEVVIAKVRVKSLKGLDVNLWKREMGRIRHFPAQEAPKPAMYARWFKKRGFALTSPKSIEPLSMISQ